MQKQFPILYTIILCGSIGVAAFVGGTLYQKNQTPRQMMGAFGNRQPGTAGTSLRQNGMGMRPVAGEIISVDETGVTLKLADGSTKIVLIADSINITKANPASRSALIVGEKLNVFGTQNTDGTIKAQSVSVGLLPLSTAPSATGAAQR